VFGCSGTCTLAARHPGSPLLRTRILWQHTKRERGAGRLLQQIGTLRLAIHSRFRITSAIDRCWVSLARHRRPRRLHEPTSTRTWPAVVGDKRFASANR
jgi:hypothetical protein